MLLQTCENKIYRHLSPQFVGIKIFCSSDFNCRKSKRYPLLDETLKFEETAENVWCRPRYNMFFF